MENNEMKRYSFATLCVHGSGGADPATGAISVPIYQSSTFKFKSARHGAQLFAGEKEGYVYTRLGNPTQSALEKEMAFLEGGEAALAFASGMAAISAVVFAYCRAGDNLVSTNTLYGGTHNLFMETLPRFNIEAREVDTTNLENIINAIDDKTRLLYIETPANPTLTITDLRACAKIARDYKIPLVVDNTFPTPYFQRPLELGADVVLHSATKYIGGHGDTVAGVVVGKKDFIDELRANFLRDLGAVISPLNAWLLVRGLKTLAIRMERHQQNAMKVAKFLQFHPKIKRVWYPGLTTHPQHELAKKQMAGFGGMISFEIKGGRRAGEQLMNAVKLITLAVSLGDVDSLIEHPASMTHSTYSEEELAKCGITESLVRLSVGIEDARDLIQDLSQALRKVKV
ncbi:Cys/Met metabolism pyridoxal-phosphate-dependent protein [Caldithrix abyssi DSM 13497]|uniref:L-methionine gamma-lyase n=1 Tax=Caldithrix abyssi DSM 13497 TaxID=880073 RepID=H1XSJ9_CALAY|nr:aminotransferase class I/II-fold pyridoxal phosphate-dependent enzyme [Caldithrix abyssi]APF18555.1 methionine-gamma-lyase [Caldithrix abyssi DSM 13497]EHO42547.1 Cys/Met metabolism pyridoxal-phosphate-dependent protein [Caldithrix abyssi DSM 13497]